MSFSSLFGWSSGDQAHTQRQVLTARCCSGWPSVQVFLCGTGEVQSDPGRSQRSAREELLGGYSELS